MNQVKAAERVENRFRHATLFYTGEEGFLEGTMPFVQQAIAAEEPVLVAVTNPMVELLRGALGGEADRVHFADMHVLGSNPARIIPAWHKFLATHAMAGRPVRGVGEPIWAGRSDAEMTECQRHEQLLNVAFDGGHAWRLLCPYDLDALDEDTIDAARQSHPFVSEDGISNVNDAYVHHHDGPGPFDGVLHKPATPPHELSFTSATELRGLRSFVSRTAIDASLDSHRTEDLVLAINELATNSLCHGGGKGKLQMWMEIDTLLCEVQDDGHITEPLIGRNPPLAEQATGRGLWVVNQLCDLVQIRSSLTGSVVRVHMRLA
jgi:anti-sigma regulatory factor (Ser/Thr protein kinase)